MEQKRFLLALVLSVGILFGWNFFFSPTPPPPQNNANNAQPTPSNTPTPEPQPAANQAAQGQQTPAEALPTLDDVPQRVLVVESPLYRIRFDSRGAVPTSWIIKKNKDSDRPIYSMAGTRDNPQPLELISQEGLKREPRETPLRLLTGDAALDAALASRNYRIEGAEGGDAGESTVKLADKETKQLDFVFRDPSSGAELVKTLTFSAENYRVDLAVKVNGESQKFNNLKLSIGPSIGDQGVSHYTFYSVAPEGITAVNGDIERPLAVYVHKNEGGWFSSPRPEGAERQIIRGTVEWAGVGDTYFAMAAVLPRPAPEVEYRTSKYEHQVNGTKEERFLITGYLPIPSDGSKVIIYTGPKDHYLLDSASKEISQALGRADRPIDLEGLIEYGLFSTVSRPLAIPILWCIKRLNDLTGSYGIAIILFTIIIYSLFFPLKWRSSKSMKKAQKLAPRMKELQERIKGMKQTDPRLKELQMEQLRLMKEGNPLGGCLPLLIQMPFLFALFRAITISLDFRQASFLWMPDLSAGDPWHLLPVLMAASMLVLQLITPAPSADPLQRKMMAVMLPVMMLYMMWSAPAGLLVYWLVGNIVGFAQQMVINRMIKTEDDNEPPPATDKAGKQPPKKLSPARASQS
jgi:YidC/Oxa1 family membrane protein insertase